MRLFLVLVILLFQNQPKAPYHQKEAANPKSSESQPAQVSTVSTPIGSSNKESPASHSEQKDEYDPRNDRLYRCYLRATIIGVIGGFLGIAVLIWQAILTRRSANAALESADAITDAERAWIDIDLSKADQLYSFVVTNYGKSLAIITEHTLIYAQMTQAEYNELPKRLEAGEEWGARQTESMYNMLLPNKPVELRRFDPAMPTDSINVIGAIVYYESIGGSYRTAVIYLVKRNLLSVDQNPWMLINVPGLTTYT